MYLPEGIVAMAIQDDEPILYFDIVRATKGLIDKARLPDILSNLRNWGYLTSEHTVLGHMYMIRGEADPMVRQLREEFWKDTLARRRWWRRIIGWFK